MAINTELFASLASNTDQAIVFSDSDESAVRDWLPTLIPGLDSVMLGGIPLSGRVTEIYGDPSIGKSTFVGQVMATAQHLGVIPVMFDVEGTTDNNRLKQLGVDPDFVIKIEPKRLKNDTIEPITIEDVFQTIIDMSSENHSRDENQQLLFVWDSVAITQPRMVANQNVGEQSVGQQARALSEGIRKVNANLIGNNASLIALNQSRDDIGGNPFLKQTVTVGGKAWQHEASLRLYMSRGKKIEDSDKEEIGHNTYLKFVKSKIGDNGGHKAEGALLQKGGYDLDYNVYIEALDADLIKGTQWKSYTTTDGVEVKKRGKDWLPFLKKRRFANVFQEGKEKDEAVLAAQVFQELWQGLIKQNFPECYPPLFNLSVPLTEEAYPFIVGMKDYYIHIQESLQPMDQNTNYQLWKKAQEG
ncbi:hypothetical protein GPK34_00520 [Secundilactobacillus kimchicus]|uniref:DNA recombination/repair protein RecA n=1 Tax=Secundilactobacillus kimchicus TaxID=528209 RepID=UPI001C034EC6|nr:DNA recombination/repair protein RecA [Secundilactobacillus kimchicus]MBT9670521.1 hypothetical protein [Secundilactobacillus kimchicus]